MCLPAQKNLIENLWHAMKTKMADEHPTSIGITECEWQAQLAYLNCVRLVWD